MNDLFINADSNKPVRVAIETSPVTARAIVTNPRITWDLDEGFEHTRKSRKAFLNIQYEVVTDADDSLITFVNEEDGRVKHIWRA